MECLTFRPPRRVGDRSASTTPGGLFVEQHDQVGAGDQDGLGAAALQRLCDLTEPVSVGGIGLAVEDDLHHGIERTRRADALDEAQDERRDARHPSTDRARRRP